MKIVCAWCNKNLEEKEPVDDKSISHGICDSCKKKVEQELEILLREK